MIEGYRGGPVLKRRARRRRVDRAQRVPPYNDLTIRNENYLLLLQQVAQCMG